MKRTFFFIVLLFTFLSSGAQNWTLIDTGAGLIEEDKNHSRQLKIIKRGNNWDARELTENGALQGIYKGNQLFAAWIQGPETKEFLNSSGKPVWLLKYRIIYPDGNIFESESAEFRLPGYFYFGIKAGSYSEGVWKIEWFVFNRGKHQTSLVATTVFQITWGKPRE